MARAISVMDINILNGVCAALAVGPKHIVPRQGLDEMFHCPSQVTRSITADAIAPLVSAEIDKKQGLLETSDVVTRRENILALMSTDRQTC